MKRNIKAVSVCSSAGIGELLLKEAGIDVVIANELLEKRANCYQHFYPDSKIIIGDISSRDIKKNLYKEIKNQVWYKY